VTSNLVTVPLSPVNVDWSRQYWVIWDNDLLNQLKVILVCLDLPKRLGGGYFVWKL
jgi:hypothetical protein